MQDHKGRLWLSTQGQGVLLIDSIRREAKHFHTGHGLLNNLVYGTVEDAQRKPWFISLHGISKFHDQGSISHYGRNEGIPLLEFNERAFALSSGKQLLLGGREGWIRFDLEEKKHAKVSRRPLWMTGVFIGNKRIERADGTDILRRSPLHTRALDLSHKQNNLTLAFSVLSYSAQQYTSYYYKFDDGEDWIRLPGNSINFSNLETGSHTLHIRATEMNENVGETDLSITLQPAPWLSWWAKSLYYLSFLLVLWYFWRRYLQSIKLKHSLRIEQLEKEKWKEVHDVKLGYFLDVSHELRTPLSLILAPLEELLDAENDSTWRKNRLDIMMYNTQRLRLLSEQVLQIKEIDAGGHSLNNSFIDLKKILQDILMSFLPIAEQKSVQLLVQLDDLLPLSYCLDQDKLEKVLFNLLQNAFKFTDEGGVVGFTAKSADDTVLLTVWDSGIGIAQGELQVIFDRFYTKNSNGQGIGIGLALCKSLVSVMGGDIVVESIKGEGSRFTVKIPCKKRQLEAEFPAKEIYTYNKLLFGQTLEVVERLPSEVKVSLSKKSILLIDDNPDILNYLSAHLREDYIVLRAADGIAGLQEAERGIPDLIISDVVMPRMDGYGLCEKIKADPNLCHIPVILLTAKISQGAKLDGLAVGADDYLPKPFHIFELKLRVKNFLLAQERMHERYRASALLPVIDELVNNSHDQGFLNRLNDELAAHIENPELNVEWIGGLIGMSRVHLFRKLKALTGMSPSDYIKNYRIKYACELLKRGDLRISEVAFKTGFQDSQYFAKVFKKEMGKSPSEYVKSI